jgi:hypothetical protein
MTDYGVISDVPTSHATLPGQDLRQPPGTALIGGFQGSADSLHLTLAQLALEDGSRVAHVQVGAHRCFDRLEFIVEFMKPNLESIGAKRGRLRSLSRWLRR